MGIRNKISSGYVYYLTLTVEEWIDVFSRPAYKHIIIDSLNYCIINKNRIPLIKEAIALIERE